MKPSTLLRLYPREWRERYADEVCALIEHGGIGLRGTFDIVRAAARERAFVHGRMPAILFMTIGLLPIAVLIAVGLSSLATFSALRLHEVFGDLAAPSWLVRIPWLLIAIGSSLYSFRKRVDATRVSQLVAVTFVAAVLMKWLEQTWLHPLVLQDLDSWSGHGRVDAGFYFTLIVAVSIQEVEAPLMSIISSYSTRTPS
jgi:hypothetical protein